MQILQAGGQPGSLPLLFGGSAAEADTRVPRPRPHPSSHARVPAAAGTLLWTKCLSVSPTGRLATLPWSSRGSISPGSPLELTLPLLQGCPPHTGGATCSPPETYKRANNRNIRVPLRTQPRHLPRRHRVHSSQTTGDHGSSAHDLCSRQPRSQTAASAAMGPDGQDQSAASPASSGPTTEGQRSPHQPRGTPPSSPPRPPWATAPVRAPVPLSAGTLSPLARLGFSAKQVIGGADPLTPQAQQEVFPQTRSRVLEPALPQGLCTRQPRTHLPGGGPCSRGPLLTPEHHWDPQSGRSGERAGHRHLSRAPGSQISAPHTVGNPSPRPRFRDQGRFPPPLRDLPSGWG